MINVIINYYKDKNSIRQKELDFCLNKNLQNELLNVIVLKSNDRINYTNYFQIFDNISSDDDINVICNLDIFLDESISLCNQMRKKDFFALTRWNLNKNGVSEHFKFNYSQDTWIFKGKPKNIKCDFPLGFRGCDNRLAHEAKSAGWTVTNPSLDIKTHHVHMSNIRGYSFNDDKHLVPPPYLTVEPCHFKDIFNV